MCGLPLLMSVGALIKSGHPSWWQAIAIWVAAWAFAILWLSRYRLEITADSVAYSSLFSRKRSVVRSEIVAADLADETGSFESPLTFVIRNTSGAELRVNSKVFSHEAVQALFELRTTS
jgi:hypothetical protein